MPAYELTDHKAAMDHFANQAVELRAELRKTAAELESVRAERDRLAAIVEALGLPRSACGALALFGGTRRVCIIPSGHSGCHRALARVSHGHPLLWPSLPRKATTMPEEAIQPEKFLNASRDAFDTDVVAEVLGALRLVSPTGLTATEVGQHIIAALKYGATLPDLGLTPGEMGVAAPSVDVEKLRELAGRLDACWRDLGGDRVGRHATAATIRSIADEIRLRLDATPSVRQPAPELGEADAFGPAQQQYAVMGSDLWHDDLETARVGAEILRTGIFTRMIRATERRPLDTDGEAT